MMRAASYLVTHEDTPAAESPVFTEAERSYCLSRGNPAASLAARLAAKHATIAALGLSTDARLAEVEVTRETSGRPGLRFYGEAERAFRDAGLTRAHVSLTHSGEYAAALVILE